jgi:hypothetical protein
MSLAQEMSSSSAKSLSRFLKPMRTAANQAFASAQPATMKAELQETE